MSALFSESPGNVAEEPWAPRIHIEASADTASFFCVLQLTDEVVAEAFPGIQSLDELRKALAESTAAQREEDQRDKVHEALIKVGQPLPSQPPHRPGHETKAVERSTGCCI